jgi:hypothetical protein
VQVFSTAILGRHHGSPRSWPYGHSMLSFCHGPSSDVGRHGCGCHRAGPRGLLRVAWSMVGHLLSGGAPQSRSQGRQSSLPNTRLPEVKPVVSWVDALWRGGRCAVLRPISLVCQ